jgi:hypothetical protein
MTYKSATFALLELIKYALRMCYLIKANFSSNSSIYAASNFELMNLDFMSSSKSSFNLVACVISE